MSVRSPDERVDRHQAYYEEERDLPQDLSLLRNDLPGNGGKGERLGKKTRCCILFHPTYTYGFRCCPRIKQLCTLYSVTSNRVRISGTFFSRALQARGLWRVLPPLSESSCGELSFLKIHGMNKVSTTNISKDPSDKKSQCAHICGASRNKAMACFRQRPDRP